MAYLWGVTLLWAFSFSLIGVYLSGTVDAYFAVLTRTLLASLVFLPLIRFARIPMQLALQLMFIGGIQLGVMYLFLYQSFSFLSVPEVVLFTIFTPVYITLLNDLLNRRFTFWYLATASLAVIGAGVIRYNEISTGFLVGFLLVQGANLCFAFGQVAYRQVMLTEKQSGREVLEHREVFGYFYLGALLVAVLGMLIWGNWEKLPVTTTQWVVLLWLGLVASGAGYFLWNKGATLVDAGALAIMNNALVPAGLLVNLLIWNREVDLTRLLLGGLIILLALWINEKLVRPRVEVQQA
ncbi:DMT family transporter [Marinospirillum alkaliphilum]|uniref:Carboxylate/amino acid/amine transporter n=1 Tax=Marinospirillum alkaliphilum DSM 21637 TaxID=1122209 RepID=A0A1K1VI38_9GAMM|nr:DMT family transporter [Marinospirillum alkaliphilum]SFX24197.1 carboxylate/amino acid/amine transporter [Marinospirillum alkaliphilum DSM 21637]